MRLLNIYTFEIEEFLDGAMYVKFKENKFMFLLIWGYLGLLRVFRDRYSLKLPPRQLQIPPMSKTHQELLLLYQTYADRLYLNF